MQLNVTEAMLDTCVGVGKSKGSTCQFYFEMPELHAGQALEPNIEKWASGCIPDR